MPGIMILAMPIYNVNASAPRLKGALGDLPSAAVLKLLHPPPPSVLRCMCARAMQCLLACYCSACSVVNLRWLFSSTDPLCELVHE